jgi:hypothetical protein
MEKLDSRDGVGELVARMPEDTMALSGISDDRMDSIVRHPPGGHSGLMAGSRARQLRPDIAQWPAELSQA